MPSFRPIVVGARFARALLVATVAFSTFPTHAQALRFDLSGDVALDEVDSVVKGHLQRVKVLTANRQWEEVIETLRQITDTRGDRVIAVVPGYYVRLRDYCHRKLAAMPPEALKIYREQVDPQAEQWFAEGMKDRDERRLRMIVDQFYCSSRGDDALRLLGEIALERGDYAAARGCWEQLLETPPAVVAADEFAAVRADATLTADEVKLLDRFYVGREAGKIFVLNAPRAIDPDLARTAAMLRTRGVVGPRLAYPQGDLPEADVYARLILVNILEGSHAWAEAGLRDLADVHPAARGRLGGRDVDYVEALTALLAESRSWPSTDRTDAWPTFAGNGARNRIAATSLDVGSVRWRVPLQPVAAGEYDFPSRRPAEDRKALLSYWPIVVDGNVFVAGASEIRGYDLATGKPAFANDPVVYRGDRTETEQPFSHRPVIGAPRFTLTAQRSRLYARMGSPITSAVVDGVFHGPTNSLVCLDLASEGLLQWTANPPTEDRWSFEGAPIADDDFVYVALRKGGVRPQAHVECRDAETGAVVWRRMICAAETPGQGQVDEITHNLLTLVGDAIYYNTNLGAVAALSKHTGEIRWVTTYPRAGDGDLNRRSMHFFRDLTPCVYDRGSLYVAPSDSRHILALDAASGLLRWETTLADDVVHLLGVADDCLLASGERQWWIRAATGRIMQVWPDESPKGYGRGQIVGDAVLRPTRTTLEIFGRNDGERRREIELTTRGAQGGNLIAVDDALLIVGGNELIVFDRHGGLQSQRAAKSEPAAPVGGQRLNSNPRVDE
jgi:outer membrane protein assembly factor BamB